MFIQSPVAALAHYSGNACNPMVLELGDGADELKRQGVVASVITYSALISTCEKGSQPQ